MDGSQPSDPYQYDPYAPYPGEGATSTRRQVALIAILAVAVLALAGVCIWLLLRGGGEAADVAVPETSPSASEATPTPSMAPAEPVEGPEPETTGVSSPDPTPTPAPAQTTVAEATSTVPPESTRPAPPTDSEVALAGLDTYLETAVSDPAAGWQLLTEERRAREDHASYLEWWGSLSAASVANCSYDAHAQVAVCDLLTRSAGGLAGSTSGVHFRLVPEGGLIRVGSSQPAAPVTDADRELLEQLRLTTSSAVVLDGRWVAVLSAKRSGIDDPLQVAANGTNTFYHADIHAMHEALSARLADAHVFMLHSSDWGKQTGQELWYTVADAGFGSAEDVERWCATSFPELGGRSLENQCLARTLVPAHGS